MSATTKKPLDGSPQDPRFGAAAQLIGRTGARSFQIRYSDDEEPTIWMAVGEWLIDQKTHRPVAKGGKQSFETAAGMTPLTAILRLLDTIIDGGMCDHCKRPSGVTDHWETEMPLADDVCWYTYHPDHEAYLRSCRGPDNPIQAWPRGVG